MVDFADPSSVVTGILKVLGPSRAVADLWTWTLIPQDSCCVGLIARHERCPGWSAVSALAIGPGKQCSPFRDPIDVRGLAHLVAIAGERGCSKVIRDDEQHVHPLLWFLCGCLICS